MKLSKANFKNFIFILIVVILIVPQTRKPLQVLLHKGVALINPIGLINKDERVNLTDYNWNLLNENGVPYNFQNTKSKIAVINFWATWCPPCIAEMPSLQKLYEKYGNKVEFLFVTSDTFEKAIAFKNKKTYSFPVYNSTSNPPLQLQTASIPRTLIISQNGEIIIDKSGAVDWFDKSVQDEIEKLLN